MSEVTFLNGKVSVITGDITRLSVDAIVNAANSSLLGGGGVDGAIHAAGGPTILSACKKIRESLYPDGLPTGAAVHTTAGNMPSKYVIHTVGPVWHGGQNNEDELLCNAYENSLKAAEELLVNSIAFPAISTGVYGFPKDRAAHIVEKFIVDCVTKSLLSKILFVFFSESDKNLFIENININK